MQKETIEGVIEDVIFHNPDTGYTVLTIQPSGAKAAHFDDAVTVVGKLMEIQPGETVRFTGTWTVHRDYGDQFKADTMQLVTSTSDSVIRLLTSGQIEGIDKATATKISGHFGTRAIDILDADASKIYDVPGITAAKAKKIAKSWEEQRRSRKVMTYLQNFGISAMLSKQIYDEYGDKTVDTIEKDPYQLAFDFESVDFKLADHIAQQIGWRSDSVERAKAGLIYAMQQIRNDGHVYAPRPLLIDKATEILSIDPTIIETAIPKLTRGGELHSIKKKNGPSGNVEVLYLATVHEDELSAAEKIRAMAQTPESRLKLDKLDWAKFFAKIEKSDKVKLTDQQKEAVKAALTNKVSVLTGGPGTGKTTTLRTVIHALDAIKAKYDLASPTGRAARRLSEATGHRASTIHRLLGYSPEGGWLHDESTPLDCDMVIIDESSMVDLELLARLLDALTDNMHLMLVGDVDQLPSVGAGDVLRDVIKSGVAHVTRLDAIFRQASDSHVVVNAHRINKGEMPDLSNASADFFMFAVNDGEPVMDLLVEVVNKRIPSKFGLNPITELQVLAPMYKGEVGILALNERLQAVLNPVGYADEQQIGNTIFRVGDKVIQTRNNYEKDVYNGDIGRIIGIDQVEQQLIIDVDGREVEYGFKEVGDLYHAYAISIHRSQGSEYPAIVMPIVTQHARMLQRNLLYTAITRAKKLVVLVGSRRAIQMAVDNDKVANRYSGLVWHIQNELKMP